MSMYRFDSEGFFVCQHEDTQCPSSTSASCEVTPREIGRWIDGAWVCDRSRLDVALAAQKSARLFQSQGRPSLMDLDVVNATDAEILAAVRTLLLERQCQ